MSKLDEAKTIIEEYTAARKSREDVTSAEIKAAEAGLQSAREQMDAARLSGDIESYKKAKAEYFDAEETIRFYSGMKSGQDMTESEYRSLTDGIRAEIRAANEAKKKRVGAILGELEEIREDLAALFSEGDRILYTLQNDIYKDPNAPRTIYLKAFDARMKEDDWGLILYLSDILERAKTAGLVK